MRGGMEWSLYVGNVSRSVDAGVVVVVVAVVAASGEMGVGGDMGMEMEVADWITEAQDASAGIGK